MTSPRPTRPFDSGARRAQRGQQPAQVDGALRQTVALLELIRQEEALLGWLDDCVAQLHAVRRARQTLLDLTDVEVAEARQVADQRRGAVGSDDGGLGRDGSAGSGPSLGGTAS